MIKNQAEYVRWISYRANLLKNNATFEEIVAIFLDATRHN